MLRFPPVEKGEPIVVSASTYVAYRVCPEQALARIRGHYPADTRSSFRGGLAHRIFARHLSGGVIGAAEFDGVCRGEIGKALNPAMARVGLRPSELRGVITEVGELYERFKRLPTPDFRQAEVSLAVEPSPGVTLKGTIDAVFRTSEGIRLVDWKTGLLGSAGHQLTFYAVLWAFARGALPAVVEAVSVSTGERHEHAPSLEDAAACLDLVADFVSRARRSLRSDEPLARVAGPWCRYCPVLDGCVEGAAAVDTLG